MKKTPAVYALSLLLLPALSLSGPEWKRLALMDVGKRLTAATSVLEEEKDWRRYSPVNLFDGDTGSCWAVGGGGIGEKVYFVIAHGTKKLSIVNGLAKSKKLFLANNRVKSLRVTVLAGVTWGGQVTEIGPVFDALEYEKSLTVKLEDHGLPQTVPLPLDWGKLAAFGRDAAERLRLRKSDDMPADPKELNVRWILSLEIREIYSGRVYNDTCLSEITPGG